MKTSTVTINGMHCANCINSVQNALKKVHGVQSSDVTLSDGQATITYDPADTSLSILEQAIEGAGYAIGNNVVPATNQARGGHCGSDDRAKKGGCCCS